MAGPAVIGALRVILGADTASFDDGLKSAQARLASFGAGMAKVGVAMGAAIAAAGVAIGVSMKRAIDEADKLGKMAQSIGIPVEELSKLKHAADLSGVSMEGLSVAVGKLSKNMVAAAQDGASQMALNFQTLGVAVQNADGSLKSSSQVLTELSGKFAGMQDGASKTALAMEFFGKSGKDMIPILNSGAAGLRAMMVEAEQLGIVIDTKTAKSAEAFNDNLTRMGKVWDGIVLQVTAEMLPAFQHFSQIMIDAAKNSTFMKAAAEGIASGLKVAVGAALTAALVFQRLGVEIQALWQALKAPNWTQMKAGFAAFDAAGEETKAKFEGLREFIDKFWVDAAATAASTAEDTSTKLASPVVQSAEKVKKAVAESDAAMKTLLASGLATYEATRTPMEMLSIEQQKIAAQFEAGAFSADTYARAMQLAAEKAGASWKTLAPSVAGSFSEMAAAFGQENQKMAKIAQVFGAVQALIATYAASAEALKLGFPMGFVAAAAVLAKGLALVMSIRSAVIPSAAKGGSFMVPGGISGTDNMMIPMNLASGERVDVTPANEARRGGGSSDVVVRGIRPRDFLTGEMLREMVDALNAGRGDGYRLRFAD